MPIHDARMSTAFEHGTRFRLNHCVRATWPLSAGLACGTIWAANTLQPEGRSDARGRPGAGIAAIGGFRCRMCYRWCSLFPLIRHQQCGETASDICATNTDAHGAQAQAPVDASVDHAIGEPPRTRPATAGDTRPAVHVPWSANDYAVCRRALRRWPDVHIRGCLLAACMASTKWLAKGSRVSRRAASA
jgi:hypothetical protein